MLRWSYFDATLRRRWCYCCGWVGWGGAITFMYLLRARWCDVDDTLMIHWSCAVDTLMLGWWYVDDTLTLGWSCVDDTLIMRCWYVDVTLIMRWWYVDHALWIRWCYVDHALMIRWWYLAAKAAETKTSATQKKTRNAVFSKLMAFVPQKPLKSHRDSHFSIPFHDFWYTHKI